MPTKEVPQTAPIGPNERLAYVLRHFQMAFDAVPEITIGYADNHSAITIIEASGSFFQQLTPYPAPPNHRDWGGKSVPFFFDPNPTAPLLDRQEGHVTIGADIISAAFYLLSGWQEYFADARDRHGRFPYAASVQKRYSFVAMPVVNYYFDVLKTAVEHVMGRLLVPRRWAGGAPFGAFISHDIDGLRSGWKAPAKVALKRGQLFNFGRLMWQHLTRPDAWDNLEIVAATVAEYGAKSTFFILPKRQPGADGTLNADFSVSRKLLVRLAQLAEQGCEIGLHGSIGTANDGRQLSHEYDRLRQNMRGLRFHYLCWEPRLTPAVVEAGSFSYDSTLGFAEHFGFRHSYCLPFYPFNFATGGTHAFLEIPLNVMDATLQHPNYLQLGSAEILPTLRPMFAEIERFGGVASVLWHNNYFDPANTVNGPRQFAEIMEYLRQRGAAFLTGSQIVAEL